MDGVGDRGTGGCETGGGVGHCPAAGTPAAPPPLGIPAAADLANVPGPCGELDGRSNKGLSGTGMYIFCCCDCDCDSDCCCGRRVCTTVGSSGMSDAGSSRDSVDGKQLRHPALRSAVLGYLAPRCFNDEVVDGGDLVSSYDRSDGDSASDGDGDKNGILREPIMPLLLSSPLAVASAGGAGGGGPTIGVTNGSKYVEGFRYVQKPPSVLLVLPATTWHMQMHSNVSVSNVVETWPSVSGSPNADVCDFNANPCAASSPA